MTGPPTVSTHDTASAPIASHPASKPQTIKTPRCIKYIPNDLLDSLAAHTSEAYILQAQQAVNFDPVEDMHSNDTAIWLTAIRRRFHAIAIHFLNEENKLLYTTKKAAAALPDLIVKAKLNGTKKLDNNLETRIHTEVQKREEHFSRLRTQLDEVAPNVLTRAEKLACAARDSLYAGWRKRAGIVSAPSAILLSNTHQNKRKRVDNHYEAEMSTSRAAPGALDWGTQTEQSGVPPGYCEHSTADQTRVDQGLYAEAPVPFPTENTGDFVDLYTAPNMPLIRRTQQSEPIFGRSGYLDFLMQPPTVAMIARTQQHHMFRSNLQPDDFQPDDYSGPVPCLPSQGMETGVDGSMAHHSEMGATMAVQTPV
ncbi:hypothetical protein MY11210_009594 [Beauveria gryllotalpidicola]